jgi:hypothetical protein
MLSLSKKVLSKYCVLIVKMVQGSVVVHMGKANYELLCNVENFLGLACIMPLLEVVQGLSKFAQGHQILICETS